MLKILNCIHSINPQGGGPATFVRQLAQLQNQFGVSLEIASLDDAQANYCQSFPGKLHALGPGLSNYGYQKHFHNWLERNSANYDLTIIHGLWQYHSLAASSVCHQQKLPYVVFPHGMLDPWFNTAYPLKHIKKQIYWWLCEQRVVQEAQAVLFTSTAEMQAAAKSFWPYACRPEIVPLGTPAPDDEPDLQEELFFQEFPNLRGKDLLLFLSRLHPKKGLDLLLQSFTQLSPRHPNLHLVLSGPAEADYEQTLRRQIESFAPAVKARITFTGMLEGQVKWGAYRACQALILPSHQENFALVVSEALACARPVLISNKVNIWHTVIAANAGLVTDDSQTGCTQLLEQWLALDNRQKQAMSINAKACFEAHFEFSRCLNNLLAVLKKYT